jgi:Protein of unknown function (DUF4239)
MTLDAVPVVALFVATILIVMLPMEGGYRLGRKAHRQESSVSTIAGAMLALLAFMLAFTFGIASNRFDARKQLVREEANMIRTAWLQSDILPEPDRAEAKGLFRDYVKARVELVQSFDTERVKSVLSQAEQIQGRLWDMAVTNARKNMNSNVAALYMDSLTEVFALHASRIAVGIQARIPVGIWLTLMALAILGMIGVEYQVGIAGSKRTLVMPLLAIAFASVIAAIAALDRPIGGFAVTQQPLIDLLSSMRTN